MRDLLEDFVLCLILAVIFFLLWVTVDVIWNNGGCVEHLAEWIGGE